MLTDAEENPFASPEEIEDEPIVATVADARPVSGVECAFLTALSSLKVGVVPMGAVGMVAFLLGIIPLWLSGELRMDVHGDVSNESLIVRRSFVTGVLMLSCSCIFVSGFVHGCVAYWMRNDPGQWKIVETLGVALPAGLQTVLALLCVAIGQDWIALWRLAMLFVLVGCAVEIGRRTNLYLRSELLPRIAGPLQ